MSVKIAGLDPFWDAKSKFRRRKFEECIEICTELLNKNPLDKAAWYLKTRAITENDYIDDCDMEEETLGDLLVNEETMNALPRPGTSLNRPLTNNNNNNSLSQLSQSIRPMTGKNRPITGFSRPSTQSQFSNDLKSTYKGSNRPGTQSRPMTMQGRLLRLGTQSLLSIGDKFINPDTINYKKYSKKPILSKILIDFLLYSEHNPRRALDLASLSTEYHNYNDWFIKLRLGQCYYQLGMYRDSEKQLLSSLKLQNMIITQLHLSKVYLKLDQPKTALECNISANRIYPNEKIFIISQARIYELINDLLMSSTMYRNVLKMDPSCVEAMASLGSQYFYNRQPEVALRYYRRLLQMGVQNSQLWNNMGLCCFYAQQYDIALPCFEQALNLCEDDTSSDIWFNISHIAIRSGDLILAYQALKIAVTSNSNHSEAWNNLGVLEMYKKKYNQAKIHFETSNKISDYLYEPLYNGALLSFKNGDCQSSLQLVLKSLNVFPQHDSSIQLKINLQNQFNIL